MLVTLNPFWKTKKKEKKKTTTKNTGSTSFLIKLKCIKHPYFLAFSSSYFAKNSIGVGVDSPIFLLA